MRTWALQAPESLALIDGQAELSRGELLNWCDATAEALRPWSGPSPAGPRLCALLAPRSWAPPLGLVAARLAGLAFLLLDPAQPTARLAQILAEARPAVVLAFSSEPERLAAVLQAAGLRPSAPPIAIAPPHGSLEPMVAQPLRDGRALPFETGHLVYTSGSTGRPKGVLLRDAPLLQTAAAQRALLGTDGSGPHARRPSVWALDPGFDASLSDIFCALLGSAPLLVVRGPQTHWRSLASAIARHGAVRADLAPSLMRVLAPEALGLQALIFGGERCDPATARRWGEACLALQAYGPTEAAVCAMMARAGPGWRDGLLGRPLPHQIVLLKTEAGLFRVEPAHPELRTAADAERFNATILTRHGAPGPPPDTARGEIWLAGEAVAIGYLDSPQAQAERFGMLGELSVHRTGDLARWSDGALVWLGRCDRQIKLNGRRVCPEEVEAVAGEVWGGACACSPDGRGLVLVLDGARKAHGQSAESVLEDVRRRLGPGLSPRRVVVFAAWPTLASGKTDFAAINQAVLSGAPA